MAPSSRRPRRVAAVRVLFLSPVVFVVGMVAGGPDLLSWVVLALIGVGPVLSAIEQRRFDR